jgi:hypothetical protein
MDLVEDDQLVSMPGKIVGGIRQLRQIRRVLQIEIQRSRFPGDILRHGGLSHLSRAKQRHGGELTQQLPYVDLNGSWEHPCNHGFQLHDCKDDFTVSE